MLPFKFLVAALAALSPQDETALPDAPAVAEAAPADSAPLALPARPAALAALSDEEVFTLAAASLQEVDRLSAHFVQTAPSGNVTTGTVYLDRPGRLRFEYDRPSAQLIVATGGMVYVHDADLETTDSYPLGKTPLRHLLGDRIDQGGAVLDSVHRAEGEVAVTLRPAEDGAEEGALALVFNVAADDTLALSRWAVFDPRGGATVVALEDVDHEAKISRRLFRVPEAGGFGLRER